MFGLVRLLFMSSSGCLFISNWVVNSDCYYAQLWLQTLFEGYLIVKKRDETQSLKENFLF